MFEQLPFSGILLCYGPLVLVIVGFIAFATLTDMNARRTYLRQMDPRPDTERPTVQLQAVTRETTMQTPAGMVVKLMPEAETAAATSPAPPPAAPNDLKEIEGIGPKMNQILQDAGITTFAALATKSPDELRSVLEAGGANVMINNPETWPEQAQLAAAGDWEALRRLQDELQGGRRE